MRFSLLAEHHDFFKVHDYVEFEGLISLDEAEAVSAAIDQHLAPREFEPLTPDEAYLAGRDLWRKDAVINKIATRRRFAEIGAELMHKRPLCLAFSQVLRAGPDKGGHVPTEKLSLQKRSSIQGLVCGLVLCLSGEGEPPTQKDGCQILPHKMGNGIFFHAKAPISFADLYGSLPVNYLLLAYAEERAVYLMNDRDPHAHHLKELGYGSGDRLKHKTHPILVRR